MLLLDLITNFFDAIDLFDSREALRQALSALCDHAGVDYFAIVHHADIDAAGPDLIRLHNYPDDFAAFHAEHRLGVRDPAHRMSQLRGSGFLWNSMTRLLPSFDAWDGQILERARRSGIGDGYTKPFHVPGERSGSCSFAVRPGGTFPRRLIPFAEALGSFAFEAARTLNLRKHPTWRHAGRLSPRERDIVILLGQGMHHKAIAWTLGISLETVTEHLKNARMKFGVSKSAVLIVCSLLSGSITYSEFLTG